jgi:hypothetical protein
MMTAQLRHCAAPQPNLVPVISRYARKLAQEFQSLGGQLATEKIDTCQIAARPGEAGDKTKLHRVFAGDEEASSPGRGSHPSTLRIEFSGGFGSWAEGCAACTGRLQLTQVPT